MDHIIFIDGTQSRLDEGHETNLGLLYKMITKAGDPNKMTTFYDAGVQGHGFWNFITIASGWGINISICAAYSHLSKEYRTGDRIFLFGFSRGAYAVRSLAGFILKMGLLQPKKVTRGMVRKAFGYYENQITSKRANRFSEKHCRVNIPIEMIGVWDTVKALGIDLPILSRLAPMATEFHDDQIGHHVKHGFHALAMDETRTAYKPVLWKAKKGWDGVMEQVWFKGSHSDIGGHVGSFPLARPLSNIPLVWMAECAERCGLALPKKWQARFSCDVNAPQMGDSYGSSKLFLFRKNRQIGNHANEYIHASVDGLSSKT